MNERQELEERLRLMRVAQGFSALAEMNRETNFRILCQVADYNRCHPDNPILPAMPEKAAP